MNIMDTYYIMVNAMTLTYIRYIVIKRLPRKERNESVSPENIFKCLFNRVNFDILSTFFQINQKYTKSIIHPDQI